MQNKPDFIIIGAQKCGTSSLFKYLEQHPDIILPDRKELHFFDQFYPRGLDWYRAQFPADSLSNNFTTGEASPYYIFHPHAASRIKAHFPEIKLIVLLRNPVVRAYSHFQMQKARKAEKREFTEAMEYELSHIHSEHQRIIRDENYISVLHKRFSYLSRGHYDEQIIMWFEHFPKQQFYFIRSEDFFSDPSSDLKHLYDFLGVRSILPADLSPMNMGHYPPLEPKVLEFLNQYYEDKNTRLPGLIGAKFQWSE